jgi:CDP-diacylglycerol--serine O-phosphatidyltransferase
MPLAGSELRRKKGIYLLPNLFTVTALFAGFYAVVTAMQGKFDNAAIAVLVAMIMDNLDGRIARWTQTQTSFGAQLDSLSDMVSFGVAPALVVYSWSLIHMGKIGWLGAFIFTVAVALRLARFNVQLGKVDKRFFKGLPSPAGAGLVVGLVWVGDDLGLTGHAVNWVALATTIITGFLMVSNIRYHSFKDIDLKGKIPFLAMLGIVLVYVLISIDPPEILFAIFLIYAISGPLLSFSIYRKKQLRKKIIKQKKLSSKRK